MAIIPRFEYAPADRDSFIHKVDNAQHREGWYGSVTIVLGIIKGTHSLHDIPDHNACSHMTHDCHKFVCTYTMQMLPTSLPSSTRKGCKCLFVYCYYRHWCAEIALIVLTQLAAQTYRLAASPE